MDENSQSLTIGTFARAAGVNIETIRFYQRKGLLPEPDKPYGSIRRYGASDVARVRFVKSAQRLGFSLDEISRLLLMSVGGLSGASFSAEGESLARSRKTAAPVARTAEPARIDCRGSVNASVAHPISPAMATQRGQRRSARARVQAAAFATA